MHTQRVYICVKMHKIARLFSINFYAPPCVKLIPWAHAWHQKVSLFGVHSNIFAKGIFQGQVSWPTWTHISWPGQVKKDCFKKSLNAMFTNPASQLRRTRGQVIITIQTRTLLQPQLLTDDAYHVLVWLQDIRTQYHLVPCQKHFPTSLASH